MPDMRIIDPFELRSDPSLIGELRDNVGRHAERRVVPMDKVEVRAKDNGEWTGFGRAAVFGDLSENLGGFREKIDHGAFRKVLKTSPDVRALFNHDPNYVLARTTAGTLTLEEGGQGLDYEFTPGPTTYANDLRILLERGEITQSSFAFRVADDSWMEDPETGGLIRTIHEFSDLFDVSPVTYPAYPTATSGIRSQIKDALKDGVDKREVTDLAWKIHRGEVEATAEERAVVDGLLEQHSTVSPWIAERTLRATAEEPELLAAVHGMRANVELTPARGDEVPYLVAARARRLKAQSKQLRAA
jgi:HK97 family phage prohead protease